MMTDWTCNRRRPMGKVSVQRHEPHLQVVIGTKRLIECVFQMGGRLKQEVQADFLTDAVTLVIQLTEPVSD